MRTYLKVGDPIVWMHGWGAGPRMEGRIEAMDVTAYPRDKYGDSVEYADLALIRANKVCISTNRGIWLYSDQILLDETLAAIRAETVAA